MTVKTLTAADVADTLKLLSADLGRVAYQRRNPGAPDDEALAWGMRNRILFVSEAIDVLTMVAMAEADKQDALPFPEPGSAPTACP